MSVQSRRIALSMLLILTAGCYDDSYMDAITRNNGETAPVPGDASSIVIEHVSSTSLTVSWVPARDDRSSSDALAYRVFYGTTPVPASVQGAAVAAQEITLGWTQALTRVSITGLSADTEYHLAIFVQDEDGNVSRYLATSASTDALAFPHPGNGGTLSRAISGGTYYLTWTAATDDLTPVDALQYRVFYSSDATTLASFETAQYQKEITLGWTVGITSVPASVLITTISLQTVNVFVRDASGAVSSYSPLLYQPGTSTNTPPVPGASGLVTVHNVAAKKITIQWSEASDAETAASELRYAVYYSTPTNLVATYESARAYGVSATGWEPFSGDRTIDNLSKATSYYLNVFVMDPDGAISAYTPVMAETTSN